MKSPRKRILPVVFRCVLLVLVLLATPIGIVWFGAKQAEKEIAAGNLPRAEKLLSLFGSLSTYPWLPVLAEARVHGVRCDLAVAKGERKEAMDHFLAEVNTLTGRGDGAMPPGAGLTFLKYREGIEAWQKGYREWVESAPVAPPDFDRKFLPEVSFNQIGREREDLVDPEPRRGAEGPSVNPNPLRELYAEAVRGESLDLLGPFLERSARDLARARDLADRPELRESDLEWIEVASDPFRWLLLDFLHRGRVGDESGAARAHERCGRLIGSMEQHPSVAILLVTFAFRSGWVEATELAMDRFTLSPATRQSFAKSLALYGSDPEFPVLSMRHEYAKMRELLASAYLGDSWEGAGPVAKRLFTRQVQLTHAHFDRLAASVSPETSLEDIRKLEAALNRAEGPEATVLAERPVFSKLFYGSKTLTEADGRRYAQAVDECNTAVSFWVVRLGLGPMGESLRELRADEAELISELRAIPAP